MSLFLSSFTLLLAESEFSALFLLAWSDMMYLEFRWHSKKVLLVEILPQAWMLKTSVTRGFLCRVLLCWSRCHIVLNTTIFRWLMLVWQYNIITRQEIFSHLVAVFLLPHWEHSPGWGIWEDTWWWGGCVWYQDPASNPSWECWHRSLRWAQRWDEISWWERSLTKSISQLVWSNSIQITFWWTRGIVFT